jgi:hypothetical protein
LKNAEVLVPLRSDLQAAVPDHSIRLYFRCEDVGYGKIEFIGDVISISDVFSVCSNTFLMRSPVTLRVGSVLYLRMRDTREASGSPLSDLDCVGEVAYGYPLKDGMMAYRIGLKGHASRMILPEATPSYV